MTFWLIGMITLMAAISPGPDFILVLQNNISYNKKAGFWTSIGVGLGILVHVSYCILGIAVLISQSILLFNIIKILGAIYLIYIGIMSIRSKKKAKELEIKKSIEKEKKWYQFLMQGLVCNVFNPKATIFFLALFTQFIAPDTILIYKVFYGLEIYVIVTLWYVFLTYIINIGYIRSRINLIQYYLGKIMGIALIYLGLKIIIQKN